MTADPFAALSAHIDADADIVRCAAARALGTLADPRSAPALVDALLDEDPDVRTDAMGALEHCATEPDAEAIRRSLAGDPVGEVKVAAVRALARLNDRDSIPVLRRLARDRCEDEIVWDDEAGAWDAWLDVQLAAISALGEMGVDDAIQDLLAARDDEFGQDLDLPVFAALAAMGDAGASTLIDVLKASDLRVRERVVRALSTARPSMLDPLRPVLLADENPAVRRLGMNGLDPNGDAVAHLALEDPDPGVRIEALRRFGPARPEIAKFALADSEESVRVTALQVLPLPADGHFRDDLGANLRSWMGAAGSALAAEAARVLVRLEGAQAEDALVALAQDSDRPLEARLAALEALGRLDSPASREVLTLALTEANQQLRIAALVALCEQARREGPDGPHEAGAHLVSAILGEIEPGRPAPLEGSAAGARDDGPAAARGEGGDPKIEITPDGEIVERGSNDLHDEPAFPKSTLDAIQAVPPEEPVSHERPVPSRAKRRVSIEGPEDSATDLRIASMRIAADLAHFEIEDALVRTVGETDGAVRGAAFAALAKRASHGPLKESTLEMLVAVVKDDGENRATAAEALVRGGSDFSDLLSAYACDADPAVRRCAVEAIARSSPETASRFLADPSEPVRSAALDACLTENEAVLAQCAHACIRADWSNGLVRIAQNSPAALAAVFETLSDPKADAIGRVKALEAASAILEAAARRTAQMH